MTVDDKENRSDDRKVNLLTDNKGYDIAMIYIRDENVVVEVSPEVLKNNKAFLRQASISNDRSKIEVGDLEELDRVIGKNCLPTMADHPKLPYIDAIRKECMRYVRSRVSSMPTNSYDNNLADGNLSLLLVSLIIH